MNEEIWKVIDNFSNYEISSFGNLRNKINKYILKPNIKSGYSITSINNNKGEKKSVRIHRLVALTFIPNPLNKETVNHKDHNKLNNNLIVIKESIGLNDADLIDQIAAIQRKNQLLEIINQTCVENKGKLIIPAFSIGRTQELVYMLDQLETEGKLPKIKVFVDSPLAINATEIFIMHPECYDRQILRYMMTDPNPFNFKGLTFTRTADQSKAINDLDEPCIIISASGMMNAGRIKHHISNNIENANNTLLVVGYCAPHTLGGRLMRKPDEIRIFGQTKKVKANIVIMPSMSAHADQGEMIDFMKKQDKSKLEKIFLVHGEIDRQTVFKDALLEDGFKRVEIPHLGQEYKI